MFHVCVCVLGLLLLYTPLWGVQQTTPTTSTPAEALAQGMQALQRGDFRQAITYWQAAEHFYAQNNQPHAQSTALINMAAAYQALGHYKKALTTLQTVQELVQHTGDLSQQATVLASLGNIHIALGPTEQAEQYFLQALQLAKDLDNLPLSATILNNLGNLKMSQKTLQAALQTYGDSVALAQRSGQQALVFKASANAAMAALYQQQHEVAQSWLAGIWEQRHSLAPTHDTADSLTKLGVTYTTLHHYLPQHRSEFLLRAAASFEMAAQVAQSIGNGRAASYAWGHWGHLYEIEQRFAEAQQLTRQAVAAAQQVQASESLYRWQWQTGRLLKAQGNDKAALEAYQRAIATLQSIRPEMATSYSKTPGTFRDTIGALYFEHIDLLLRHAATFQDPQDSQPYLGAARDSVELFKAAELRDYFQDECVDAARSRRIDLDRFAPTTIIVYPILLPDRLELLVSLPQGLQRFLVPVTLEQLERVVYSFREALQKDVSGGSAERYLRHAQRLYDWLIRPLEPELAARAPGTVVFVPDGVLRTIPMAALHDGQHFLIEKYPLAITPGIDLTDPQPLSQKALQALVAGVTEEVQGFAALPAVTEEVATIQRLYKSTVLLNQNFIRSRVEKELRAEDFGIVHIASHGQFIGEIAQSFILTFDGKLTMEQLGAVVRQLRFREESLELLTFSACETALGDDRAALGLAGIAIKAGAKSALATLWRVHDEAAALVMQEFYRQLKEASVSRAVALQRAQLRLLADARYRSPFFWAPFLLINNWL